MGGSFRAGGENIWVAVLGLAVRICGSSFKAFFGPTVPEATTSQREGAVWPHNAMGRNLWLNSCKVWCQPNKLAGSTANGPTPTPAATSCSGGATIQNTVVRATPSRPPAPSASTRGLQFWRPGATRPRLGNPVGFATRPRAGVYGQPAPT